MYFIFLWPLNDYYEIITSIFLFGFINVLFPFSPSRAAAVAPACRQRQVFSTNSAWALQCRIFLIFIKLVAKGYRVLLVGKTNNGSFGEDLGMEHQQGLNTSAPNSIFCKTSYPGIPPYCHLFPFLQYIHNIHPR
jgi:hypothetical protein